MRTLTLPVCVLLALATAGAQENPDLSVINRIKSEEFQNSKVMEHLEYLTDVYGPRLTGSPEFKEAADWALKRLESYGLVNGHLEKWGPFGRSWTPRQYALEMLQPRYALLDAAPLAWSRNTNGPVAGDVILAPLPARTFDPVQAEKDLDAYIAKYKGKLRGKIVLISNEIRTGVSSENRPLLRRYTDAELASIAAAPEPVLRHEFAPNEPIKFPEDPMERLEYMASLPQSVRDELRERGQRVLNRRSQFFNDEGVVALLQDDGRAHDALIFAEQAGSRKAGDPEAPPTFVVTKEQYDRLLHLVRLKQPVRLQANLRAEQSREDVDSYNIIAEIPGATRPDEVVMVGAHFDSWHTGTGATDNGAGSAVMMEVVRILKALNLKMDRTVRIGLWGGEEEGLLGSEAYVKEHFGDPKTMRLTSAHAKLSGYYNLDNGSGKIRGVYLQGNDAMRPLFERWLAPFRDLGVTTITIRNTGGTDHLSFDAVGLPGFQFIQDPLDYFTVTHHSDMDTYDHAVAGDLMQASAVIASLVYDTANMREMLPRKALPKPQQSEHPTSTRD